MKGIAKLLGFVTSVLLIVIVSLQGSVAGEALNEFIGDFTGALGVGATGYGLVIVLVLADYLRKRFGIDVAHWLLDFVKNEDAEAWAEKLFGSEKAKELLVQRDEYIQAQKEDLEDKILEKKYELLDLKAKIKNEVLDGPELELAKQLAKEIERWLDEKNTENH